MDGILNIDKPYGITSMELVRRIKRASGVKRVGHGGTLDPIATGVVTVSLGQATRVMEYVIDGAKEYSAVVELGTTTDTYDALGEANGGGDYSRLEVSDVERVLEGFRGTVEQVPPMYSALKRGGKRLYDLARAGIEVPREPRSVEVHGIELVDWEPPLLGVRVRCGRGFYMRSLAHDLGEALGCGAHLKSLVRLRSGIFELADAASLDDAETMFEDGSWRDALHAPDSVLGHMEAVVVSSRLQAMLRNGRPLPIGLLPPSADEGTRCRAYGVDGAFVAILAFDKPAGHWRPEKVFSLTYDEDEREWQ